MSWRTVTISSRCKLDMKLVYKLFIFVNMRSYFDDSQMQEFVKTAQTHAFSILLIDSSEHGRPENENRVIVDEDLCVI